MNFAVTRVLPAVAALFLGELGLQGLLLIGGQGLLRLIS